MAYDMTPVPVPRDAGHSPGAPRWDGKRARARRQFLSMSIADVAAATALSRASLKAMERDKIKPSEAAFLRLTWAYRLRADNAAEVLCHVGGGGSHDHRADESATEVRAAARAARTPRRTARLSAMVEARRRGDRR